MQKHKGGSSEGAILKVLFIDGLESLMLDIVMRAQKLGHDCRWFFPKTEKNKCVGKGLAQIVDDWRPWMRWADLVILADNVRYLREVDAWRSREGIKVVGATQQAADWELNRILGQKIMKKAGMDVLPFREFGNYDQAIAYVEREMKRFVSKPIGDEPDKSLSYVAKSPADLVYMLERWKKAQKLKGKFMLQDFVPGVEMAVGAFFGPGGFSEGWVENWEEKKLMAGGSGPNCGEMGTTIRAVKRSKLADMVLKPLEDDLDALKYCGYVDVNCMIDEDGTPWPLEFTMRFGWPTFNIQQSLLQGDFIEWLADLCDGRDSRPWRMNKIACGAVMAQQDYPYSHLPREQSVGIPMYGLTEAIMPQVHPCEMMMGTAPQEKNGTIVSGPMMVTAGDYVLLTTGTGDTVSQARKSCYRVMEKLKAPSSPFWRPDIATRLKRELPLIQRHGFASKMIF